MEKGGQSTQVFRLSNLDDSFILLSAFPLDNNLIMSLGQLFGYRRTFGLGIQWRNRTVGNKMFMQWWGDVKAISFYLRSTFGHGGQICFQKPTTA